MFAVKRESISPGGAANFGFCETPSVLRDLDQWIRRRLRAIAWKQWKRGPTRAQLLQKYHARDRSSGPGVGSLNEIATFAFSRSNA